LAVGFAASLGFADSASATKKLTYDQAWAVCKAKMDKAGVPGLACRRMNAISAAQTV
jgi:hypothetical protein